MKKIAYLFIALVSVMAVMAIDEFKPGDRYYFSISNQSGGITGGDFDYNLTDMNMTEVLQADKVTEFGNGIYYWNITTAGSTEPRTLQINGSYGTSNYLNMVDMIYILSTRIYEEIDSIEENQATISGYIGDPTGNSTTLWDYTYCATGNFNNVNTCLFYRQWVLYPWRTTSGIQT